MEWIQPSLSHLIPAACCTAVTEGDSTHLTHTVNLGLKLCKKSAELHIDTSRSSFLELQEPKTLACYQ